MADDDIDDVMFTREALEHSRLRNDFHSVSDGVELLDDLSQHPVLTRTLFVATTLERRPSFKNPSPSKAWSKP